MAAPIQDATVTSGLFDESARTPARPVALRRRFLKVILSSHENCQASPDIASMWGRGLWSENLLPGPEHFLCYSVRSQA